MATSIFCIALVMRKSFIFAGIALSFAMLFKQNYAIGIIAGLLICILADFFLDKKSWKGFIKVILISLLSLLLLTFLADFFGLISLIGFYEIVYLSASEQKGERKLTDVSCWHCLHFLALLALPLPPSRFRRHQSRWHLSGSSKPTACARSQAGCSCPLGNSGRRRGWSSPSFGGSGDACAGTAVSKSACLKTTQGSKSSNLSYASSSDILLMRTRACGT